LLWAAQLGELSVDAVTCEPASQFLSSHLAWRHDTSVDTDDFGQEMSPTVDALDLDYYHGLDCNTSSLRQRSFEGCLFFIGKG
jgi:hypothetical protein